MRSILLAKELVHPADLHWNLPSIASTELGTLKMEVVKSLEVIVMMLSGTTARYHRKTFSYY